MERTVYGSSCAATQHRGISACISRTLAMRRGSTMVESAIFFPLIVLSAMFAAYMIINMYSMTALQSYMHILVRGESAAKSGTADIQIDAAEVTDRYRQEAESKKIDTQEGKRFMASYMEAECAETYYGGRLTRRNGVSVRFHGRVYIIDEANFVRTTRLLPG
jgi:hypothetical protein